MIVLLLLGVLACGSGPATGEPGGTGHWTPLLMRSWTAQPGSEMQPNFSATADRDYAITAIRAVDPAGTHHVDIVGPGSFHNVLFVSVMGTGPFYFPNGVGLRIRQGDALTLQLHVVNTTDHVVEGTSGIEVLEAVELSTMVEANILNPAVTVLDLPPGSSQASGTCRLTQDQTFFAIAPHMHKLGVRFKSTLTQNGVAHVLLDEDFSFSEQVFVPFEAIAAHAGDSITAECTWNNTTPDTVHWGATADEEMCSAFVYRYPVGDSSLCTE